MLRVQDASVVICCYSESRWNELINAVASVGNQTIPPREIILVTDHNPALAERVRQFLPHVLCVQNLEQPGLGGARNCGVRAAGGDVVAFIDDDAIAEPDWLERLLSGYEDSSVAGVGGLTIPDWESSKPGWFPDEFGWVVGCSYRGMPELPAMVRNLHGCNMSFRRQVFDRMDGFQLGYGCDEVEFCIRLQQQLPGAKLLYQPDARVRHRVTADRSTARYFRSRCFFEGGSKAVVSWLVGPQALASERTYTLRTLPRGVVRGLGDALLRGDRSGLERAGAIILGLTMTGLGYLGGRIATVQAARKRGWYEQRAVATLEAS